MPLSPAAAELEELIRESRAEIIGPIRQELLSGIRDASQFERLKVRLRDFTDLPLTTEDYERASELSNLCRRNGVQGSHTDFLICAVAEARHQKVLTVDRAFKVFARLLPLALHAPRPGR